MFGSILSPMKVILAKSAGFCWGVQKAIEKARVVAHAEKTPVYTDGPLIHNRQMTDQLAAEGILETQDPCAVGDATLIIRAHGIPPQRRTELQQLPVTLVDATCPNVARIHDLIRQHVEKNFSIVIFGDRGHAEVMGLLGFSHNKGFVVNKTEDIHKLPEMDPVCLVAQSTQLPAAYDEIAEAVRSRFAHVEVLDTICKSTKNRQDELASIAASVDAIVVVGAKHSANTLRLVRLAESLRPTFHVQTADELNPDAFRGFRSVGVTAGASTPRSVIEDVTRTLKDLPG
jgi:4-hydroxy-3-methylbut-2-enyl diphosphate reductase